MGNTFGFVAWLPTGQPEAWYAKRYAELLRQHEMQQYHEHTRRIFELFK